MEGGRFFLCEIHGVMLIMSEMFFIFASWPFFKQIP